MCPRLPSSARQVSFASLAHLFLSRLVRIKNRPPTDPWPGDRPPLRNVVAGRDADVVRAAPLVVGEDAGR